MEFDDTIDSFLKEAVESDDVRHFVGNPVFAIMTSIEPLKKRIIAGKTAEALEVLEIIESSMMKINNYIVSIKGK